jgi:hypothetical protein
MLLDLVAGASLWIYYSIFADQSISKHKLFEFVVAPICPPSLAPCHDSLQLNLPGFPWNLSGSGEISKLVEPRMKKMPKVTAV